MTFRETAQRILTLDGALEDLPRAQLLGVLLRVGPASAVVAPLKALSARVSRESGLISQAPEATATVPATYLFSRLLDLRFREVASPATRARLRTAAGDPATPLTTALQATAALKAAGDTSWPGLAKALLKRLPRPGPVGLAGLPDYL